MLNLNLTGGQIENLLKKAWKKFVNYYDKKAPEYAKSYSKSLSRKKEPIEEHWICWNESDLMVQLGRYFYEQLPKNSNIEMHFDKNLSKSNFTDYDCEKKLKELKKRLGRVPKLDLIITQEDSSGPFKLCAEAKYFHYSEESMSQHKKTVEGLIRKDIKTLLTIRDLGIADNVVFIMFDDYYWIASSIMKCNTLDSGKEFAILGVYAKPLSSFIFGRSRMYRSDARGGENG